MEDKEEVNVLGRQLPDSTLPCAHTHCNDFEVPSMKKQAVGWDYDSVGTVFALQA